MSSHKAETMQIIICIDKGIISLGNLWEGSILDSMDLQPVFDAINEIIEGKDFVEIKFDGNRDAWIDGEYANNYERLNWLAYPPDASDEVKQIAAQISEAMQKIIEAQGKAKRRDELIWWADHVDDFGFDFFMEHVAPDLLPEVPENVTSSEMSQILRESVKLFL